MAQWVNLESVPGDDIQFPFSITQNRGILNITGWVIYFIVKRFESDLDSAAVIDIQVTNHTSPSTGQSFLRVPGTTTIDLSGRYYYQFTFVNNNGIRLTPLKGILLFGFNLLQNVT